MWDFVVSSRTFSDREARARGKEQSVDSFAEGVLPFPIDRSNEYRVLPSEWWLVSMDWCLRMHSGCVYRAEDRCDRDRGLALLLGIMTNWYNNKQYGDRRCLWRERRKGPAVRSMAGRDERFLRTNLFQKIIVHWRRNRHFIAYVSSYWSTDERDSRFFSPPPFLFELDEIRWSVYIELNIDDDDVGVSLCVPVGHWPDWTMQFVCEEKRNKAHTANFRWIHLTVRKMD